MIVDKAFKSFIENPLKDAPAMIKRGDENRSLTDNNESDDVEGFSEDNIQRTRKSKYKEISRNRKPYFSSFDIQCILSRAFAFASQIQKYVAT